MQAQDIQALLEAKLESCEVNVQGDGSHFDITVIGLMFDGLRAVKKQQLVYAVLSEEIASGAIHAVNMKLYTPQEWAQQTN
ncbi:MAG: acid stress-induced BolA-like protein IbaG/YrbA [Chitinophagales bacterium]|jgi:acid stress-induced BolA-like protein IbaG/YrbA|tara:strand:- start:16111 stop:16353 length:243 start_codon:yes stop_codon:yes gene_type:complete